jgi:hypothetical protein
MDNTFGTVMEDSSGNGNNGTTYNIVTSGAGYIFDGISSKAVVPHSDTLYIGARDFSYSAVFWTDRVPPSNGDFDIIRKGAASTAGGGFRLEIENSKGKGVAYCSVSDNAGHTLSVRGKLNLSDAQPHTAICEKTAAGLTLEVDSLAPVTKAGVLGAITNTKDLAIGCKSPNCDKPDSDWYNGLLRSVTISVAD